MCQWTVDNCMCQSSRQRTVHKVGVKVQDNESIINNTNQSKLSEEIREKGSFRQKQGYK